MINKKLLKKIDEATSTQEAFSKIVYTPINEALLEIYRRETDELLVEKLKEFYKEGAPDQLKNGRNAILFRQLTTPNYETRRFMMIPDVLELKPVFMEYHNDKFTSNNELKCRLGKLSFHHGTYKNGDQKRSYKRIIDFHESDGKKIKEVNTLWGQNLIDFHHKLFAEVYPEFSGFFFDASDWLMKNGGIANKYYSAVMALFIKDAILFENFNLKGHELEFVKKVFLPAFFDIWEKTGEKPLIVDFQPTSIEGDTFWLSHPHTIKQSVVSKLA